LRYVGVANLLRYVGVANRTFLTIGWFGALIPNLFLLSISVCNRNKFTDHW